MLPTDVARWRVESHRSVTPKALAFRLQIPTMATPHALTARPRPRALYAPRRGGNRGGPEHRARDRQRQRAIRAAHVVESVERSAAIRDCSSRRAGDGDNRVQRGRADAIPG